jgi:RNA polymerase sigma-70 factor (ECF subfamily)
MSIIKGIFTSRNQQEDAGGEAGFEALFKEFYDRLVYFSFQFVYDKDQARDIVQDAFIKYWNQREEVLDNKAAIKNFLYSTVRNASLNYIRHSKIVEGYIQLHNTIEPEEAPIIDAIITAEVVAEIHAAIQSLPESYRQVSILSYLEGKKNQEIADELEMSINTVKKQKQRALQLLRVKMVPEMYVLLLAALAAQITR